MAILIFWRINYPIHAMTCENIPKIGSTLLLPLLPQYMYSLLSTQKYIFANTPTKENGNGSIIWKIDTPAWPIYTFRLFLKNYIIRFNIWYILTYCNAILRWINLLRRPEFIICSILVLKYKYTNYFHSRLNSASVAGAWMLKVIWLDINIR